MGYSKQRASRSVNLEHTPEKSTGFDGASQHGGEARIVLGQTDPHYRIRTGAIQGFLQVSGGFSVMRAVRLSAFSLLLPAVFAGSAFSQQPQNVPDAPAPQAQSAPPNAPVPQNQPLPDLKNQVAPGKATTSDQDGAAAAGQPAPNIGSGAVGAPQQAPPPDAIQPAPPATGAPGQEPVVPPEDGSRTPTIHIPVTYVDVPVTVKDKHGKEVPGLPWWRFRIYEDGVRQRIAWFTTDAFPLSIAFVVDATLPSDIMYKVNKSFSEVNNALTPADTVAIVSYGGTGPQLITTFTAAQANRLPAAFEMAKRPGEQPGVPLTDGPFATGPTVNGLPADPTLTPQRGNASGILNLPKEVHPLNDAILYAAEQLASQPRGRRRIIYVVTDGKNSRSKASYKEVVQYLLSNNISVFGTNVGDSALWGIGYLDRTKLPFLQPEDLLPRYAIATGGDVDHEVSENGIQNAFVKIADSVRTAYTLGYYSHQPTISGKYHVIDVHLEGLPGYQIDAKQGYYPSVSEQ
jgi:VWFA-related protein